MNIAKNVLELINAVVAKQIILGLILNYLVYITNALREIISILRQGFNY